jgi:hypothetical protein
MPQQKPARSTAKRNNLTFRVRDQLRERLEQAAQANQRSVSEEIEHRLNRDFAWEAANGDIAQLLAQARAERSTARVHALRAAGLQILREIEARPTRVIIDIETLLAEADGIARGLRSGFSAENAPAAQEPGPMTAEQEQRLLQKFEELKQMIQAATEKTSAADNKAA